MQFKRDEITPEWMDLCEEFPEIFLEPSQEVLDIYKENYKIEDADPNTLCNLRFGVEVGGTGWKKIIREFCVKIRELIAHAKTNGHEIGYKTFILKEKFGELRDQGEFYGRDALLYMNDYNTLSWELENASSHICEITGKVGTLVHNERGSYKTLCEEQALKLGYIWK